MSLDGMYHISEIIEGWPRPFWVEDEEGDSVAEGEADAAAASGGTGRAGAGLDRWRVVAVGLMVVALGAALFGVSRSSGREAVGVAAPTVAMPGDGQETGDVVIDAAERAFEAWGRFAVTGDMALLEPWFAVGGPQMAQLRAEAEALDTSSPIGGPPYEFLLERPELIGDGMVERVVRGDVTVERPGEQAQSYQWEIEMKWSPALDGWQLWTVRTTD